MSGRILPPPEAGDLSVAALRESEERFRNVFVQAPLPQALVDAEGRYVAANARFCELVGYSPADLLTRHLGDLTHEEDWPSNKARMDALMAGDRDGFDIDKRYVRSDGEIRYVHNHVRLIRDDAGRAKYVHAIVLDLTAQRQAEAALAASQARLRALLGHTGDLVLLLGADGRVRDAGPNCEAVAPALLEPGATVFDVLDTRGAARLRTTLGEVLLRGGEGRVHASGTVGDCRRVWDVRLDNRLADPMLQGVVAVFRDVTRQMRAEELAEGEGTVLRMMLTGASSRQLLEAAARTVEHAWPDLRATVLLVDRETGCLRHGAAPSMPAHFVEAVDGLPITEGAAVCGTAAFRNAPVIVEDVRADPLAGPYRPLLESIGAGSLWSLPLHDAEGDVVGTLALYGRRAGVPSAEQWRQMQRLAHLASLVVAHARAVDRPPATGELDERAVAVVGELTHRERAVLRLLALGHTSQEMAEALRVSVRTVEAHRARVVAKANASTRAELVRLALAAGLLRTELR